MGRRRTAASLVAGLAMLGCVGCGGTDGPMPGAGAARDQAPASTPAAAPVAGADPAHGAGGPVVMLGDSITNRSDWSTAFASHGVVVQGVDGNTSSDVLARVDAVTRLQPSAVFLLIGVNDLRRSRPVAEVRETIQRILAAIHAGSPETDCYLVSVFPVRLAASYTPMVDVAGEPRGLPAGRAAMSLVIAALNAQLPDVAARADATYLAVAGALADDDGQLRSAYTMDGLHLSAAGYRAIDVTLRPYVCRYAQC